MPTATMKKYAEQSGKSVEEVEQIWEESKKEADKKFKKRDSHYWAYVNATTKKKLGLDKQKPGKESLQEKPLYHKWL